MLIGRMAQLKIPSALEEIGLVTANLISEGLCTRYAAIERLLHVASDWKSITLRLQVEVSG